MKDNVVSGEVVVSEIAVNAIVFEPSIKPVKPVRVTASLELSYPLSAVRPVVTNVPELFNSHSALPIVFVPDTATVA